MDDVLDVVARHSVGEAPFMERPFGLGDERKGWDAIRRAEFTPRALLPAPGAAAQAALDMLRTKIAALMQDNNWVRLAVTSPTARCGTTTLAAGLAVSLARQRDTRVVLLDFNLRKPDIASSFGLKGNFAIADFLNGAGVPQDSLVRYGDRLAIGANGRVVADPAEMLHSSACAEAIERLQQRLQPSLIIFDLPPMLEHDDLLGFLPFVDSTLLVLGAEHSTLGQADICERELSTRSKLLGVVLNKCRLGLGAQEI